MQKTNGTGMAMASAAVSQILQKLEAIERNTKHLTDVFIGKYYYEQELSMEASVEETEIEWGEQIPQGYIFIPQRISVSAPEGSRLEIYQNNVSGANFLEVITNVQLYSEAILGPWIVQGPCRLAFVLTKAKVDGSCSINISGNLIPRDLTSHRP